MQDKGQEWVDNKNEHLHQRQFWSSVDRQFWPKVGCGLWCVVTHMNMLSDCLETQYWQMMPLGGIIRMAETLIRQLDRGFNGAGCHHVGVEAIVKSSSKLMMHYNCKTSLGFRYKCPWNCLLSNIELGMSFQPFKVVCYTRLGEWITMCYWLNQSEENNALWHPPQV